MEYDIIKGQINADIYSLELEKYLIAGFLRNPSTFPDVASIVTENDFTNKLHQMIFGITRQILSSQEKLEIALVSERINILSLSFEDRISSVYDYLSDLKLIQIQSDNVISIAEDLKIVTMRREIAKTSLLIASSMNTKFNSQEEVLSAADKIYNGKISIWDSSISKGPENICGSIRALINERIANPIESVGFLGPHKLLNQMYGSILRPGNISLICARSAAGKSTVMTDYCFKTAQTYGVPILHLDAGELLKEEIQFRLAAGISGVPLNLIENGKVAKDKDMLKALNAAMDVIEKVDLHYHNTANQSTEEILSTIRRFYLSQVGRGNQAIVCYDYLKSQQEKASAAKAEWESMGILVTKIKDFISKEAIIPVITAVQGNRGAITTGKLSDEIQTDESVFSGSDRTIWYSSAAFVLRKKTLDELSAENSKWGTHVLTNVKARHLGEDIQRATRFIKTSSGRLRPNHINLEVNNFACREVGDFYEQAKCLEQFNIEKRNDSLSNTKL